MSSSDRSANPNVIRVPPYEYLHVLDQNTNISRVEVGPQTFIRKDHEKVILGPVKMVIIPPNHYARFQNPVIYESSGELSTDRFGQVRLRHAAEEIRLHQEPFPLFPGEILLGKISPLVVVPANYALRLKAINDFDDTFTDDDGKEAAVKRLAGDEYLFEGPGTYIPKVHENVIEEVASVLLYENQALCLRARKSCISRDGVKREAGEKWHVTKIGNYLPGTYEEVVTVVKAAVLTDNVALQLEALNSFKDAYGKARKIGERWLITSKDTESHIPSVHEKVIGEVSITTLTNRQYCVIKNPVDSEGKPQLGRLKLVKGEISFFLQPGESLSKGIQDVVVLGEEEALLLRAESSFKDVHGGKEVVRQPGDRWMVFGPAEYIPPVEVVVLERRKTIPLDKNEGIYVQDISVGHVRAVIGQTYMLKENEELWNKELPASVESLLNIDPMANRNRKYKDEKEDLFHEDKGAKRMKSRVVQYRVPHNAAIQIYDYRSKKSRVEFGPELVMLQPDEQFTEISLSGGKPKRQNHIRSLCLLLGPDFATDIITIETSDHARLSLQLSYNWFFRVDKTKPEEAARLFSVPDFIGDACKAVASRVRGAVASVPFDNFHKNSAEIIRRAVFGVDSSGECLDEYEFTANGLVLNSIDIQSVEPVDQRTRDSLQKSVQLAIEITTNSQEAKAKHDAERIEQEAKGRLERQQIQDMAQAEEVRKHLLELQARTAAIESTGQAIAEAQARSESARIEGEAAVHQAELKAKASTIESESEFARLEKARTSELNFIQRQNELEIEKAKDLAEIEISKFQKMVAAIGPDTLVKMAQAGPEMQAKLLGGLGLKSTLITDGKSPINLFQTANGLISNNSYEAQ